MSVSVESWVTTRDLPAFDALALPASLVAELRSDLAGEAGAVMMYRGLLAVSRNAAVRRFAAAHLETERQHLAFFERWLPPAARTRLLPLWRALGWLTGAVAGIAGPRWTYATIEVVETFVVAHYGAQIEALRQLDPEHPLATQLAAFSADEDAHRCEAAAGSVPHGLFLKLWLRAVDGGSRLAVRCAAVV